MKEELVSLACFTGTKVQILTQLLMKEELVGLGGRWAPSVQFTCFTGTKVQMLTQLRQVGTLGTQFTCFTGTKVQILTQLRQVGTLVTQFTCFTGTKVQILTHLRGSADECAESANEAQTCGVRDIHTPLSDDSCGSPLSDDSCEAFSRPSSQHDRSACDKSGPLSDTCEALKDVTNSLNVRGSPSAG
jgi:hypothetical protein